MKHKGDLPLILEMNSLVHFQEFLFNNTSIVIHSVVQSYMLTQ
jgi:hypothetical protein